MHPMGELPTLSDIPGLAENPSIVGRRCGELVTVSIKAWEADNSDTSFDW